MRGTPLTCRHSPSPYLCLVAVTVSSCCYPSTPHSATATPQYRHSMTHSVQSCPNKIYIYMCYLMNTHLAIDRFRSNVYSHVIMTATQVLCTFWLGIYSIIKMNIRTCVTWYSGGIKLSMMVICSLSSRLSCLTFSNRPSISRWCSCWRSAIYK